MKFRDSLEKMAEIYGGIAIFSVERGSTTHRAGVRAGDVLVAVNGRRVRRLADYAAARNLRKEVLELVVVRNGQSVRLWAGDAAIAMELTPMPSGGPPPVAPGVTCSWRGAA